MQADAAYFDELTERRRAKVKPVLEEYSALKAVNEAISPQQIHRLFAAAFDHEKNRAGSNSVTFIARQSLPTTYSRSWVEAFLETVAAYRDETTDYPGIIAKFEAFQAVAQNRMRALPPDLRHALEERKKPLADLLNGLQKAGLGPELLGEMEAHWQMRRLAQVFHARFSAERRDARASRKQTNGTISPNLPAYSRRQNKRASLMNRPETRPGQFDIDSTLYLTFYIDSLGHFPGWQEARQFYEQKILLLPGLFGADNYIDFVMHRHGTLAHGLEHVRREASHWQPSPMLAGEEEDEIQTALRAEQDLLASHVMPTLCLMNVANGSAYAGEYESRARQQSPALLPILKLSITPDIYTPEEIACDWSPILEAWKKAAPKATMRTIKSASTDGRPKLTIEERLAHAQTRMKNAREALEKANDAESAKLAKEELTKAGRAYRRAENASKAQDTHSQEWREEKEKITVSQKNAEKTRERRRAERQRKAEEKRKAAALLAEKQKAAQEVAAPQPKPETKTEPKIKTGKKKPKKRRLSQADWDERRAYAKWRRELAKKRPPDDPKPGG